MNQPRPENHVTRRLSAPTLTPSLPAIDTKLLEALEERYPARCLGTLETVEDHLRYAGKVELVGLLRAEHNARITEDLADSEEPDLEALVANGERANS